jgi:hypothetical protein
MFDGTKLLKGLFKNGSFVSTINSSDDTPPVSEQVYFGRRSRDI